MYLTVEQKDQAMHRDSQAPYQTADQTDYHHVYHMTQQRRHSSANITNADFSEYAMECAEASAPS